MSKARKHVTLAALQDDAKPPKEGQIIVRALGSRGSNLVEVEYPDGRTSFVFLPARFNKKIWVRRGGYLIIEDALEEVDEKTRVTGTIVSILHEQQEKHLRKMEGVWPVEFGGGPDREAARLAEQLAGTSISGDSRSVGADAAGIASQAPAGGGDSETDSNDGLPPLEANTNRKIIEYEVSDSDSD